MSVTGDVSVWQPGDWERTAERHGETDGL